MGYLRARGVTAYMTYEVDRVGAHVDLAETPLAVLAENLMLLRNVEHEGRVRRLFSIMHMRFSDHDHRAHEYTIEAGQGIVMRDVATPDGAGQAPAGRESGVRRAESSGGRGA